MGKGLGQMVDEAPVIPVTRREPRLTGSGGQVKRAATAHRTVQEPFRLVAAPGQRVLQAEQGTHLGELPVRPLAHGGAEAGLVPTGPGPSRRLQDRGDHVRPIHHKGRAMARGFTKPTEKHPSHGRPPSRLVTPALPRPSGVPTSHG